MMSEVQQLGGTTAVVHECVSFASTAAVAGRYTPQRPDRVSHKRCEDEVQGLGEGGSYSSLYAYLTCYLTSAGYHASTHSRLRKGNRML